jgi:hypothetical protein
MEEVNEERTRGTSMNRDKISMKLVNLISENFCKRLRRRVYKVIGGGAMKHFIYNVPDLSLISKN